MKPFARMASFLTAIGIMCFSGRGTSQLSVNIVTWAAVLILISWTVLTGWETRSGINWRYSVAFWRKDPVEEEISDGASLLTTRTRRSTRSRRSRRSHAELPLSRISSRQHASRPESVFSLQPNSHRSRISLAPSFKM